MPFTKIIEDNLSVFVYRLFHEDFSPIVGTNVDLNLFLRLERHLHEAESNTDKLPSVVFVPKALH